MASELAGGAEPSGSPWRRDGQGLAMLYFFRVGLRNRRLTAISFTGLLLASFAGGAAYGLNDPGGGSTLGSPGAQVPLHEPLSPRKRRQPKQTSIVLLRRGEPLNSFAEPSTQHSRACRNGRFRQRQDRRYIAVLNGKIYGAAVGGHGGLRDRSRLSMPGMIYIFVGQGTTNCRVYQAGDICRYLPTKDQRRRCAAGR